MTTIKDYIEGMASPSITDYMEKAILGALEDREDILIPKDFAYVPDVEKPSTWRLRLDLPEQVLNSIVEFREMLVAQVIPEDRVEGIKQRLRAAYETFFPERGVPELIQANDPLDEVITGLDSTPDVPSDTNQLLSVLQQLLTAFNPTQKSSVDVVKAVQEEQRMAMFVALKPNVPDAHGDIYDEAAVEQACIDFNVNCMKTNLWHEEMTEAAQVVQSYITPVDFITEDGREITKGTWIQWWSFNDDEDGEALWKGVKSGFINGISIGCIAEVENL